MSNLGYVPTIEETDNICPKCKTGFRYIDTGKCAGCLRKSFNKNSNMDLVNKLRRLMKEQELRGIDKDYYFED